MSDSVVLASSVQGETIPVTVRDMNMGIFNLYGGNMPNPSEETDIYMRLRAVISNATPSPLDPIPTVKPLYSNVIEINVLPYFAPNLMPFTEVAELFPYYIIGYTDWDNSPTGLGTSLIPLGVIAGDYYNLDGQGTFEFTGYFETSKTFKLVGEVGNWNIQWGNGGGDGINNPVHNDGGSSNFQVPTDGYYTITLNTITNELSIDATGITPTVYSNMGLVGTINDWGGVPDIAMTPWVTTANNHLWYVAYTFAADQEVKFRYNNDWGNNWGSNTLPWGIATLNGANIRPESGTYTIIFNDIDGSYAFLKK
jgi:hypothetical protein